MEWLAIRFGVGFRPVSPLGYGARRSRGAPGEALTE